MYNKAIVALALVLVLASCASRKSVETTTFIEQEIALAGKPNNMAMPQITDETKETATPPRQEAPYANKNLENEDGPIIIAAPKTIKKAKSFSQMKEMVKNGDIAMSKRDVKTLNKLDKLYKGNFTHREGEFEWTQLAKIIAGVGAAALLISLFTGNWFFAFVFIVAALAFICRWVGIIDF